MDKHLLHPREEERLSALIDLDILDTPAEENYDAVVHLASNICKTPISTITLIDADRQWFKAKVGVSHNEDPREISFCAHCILGDDIFEINDTREDPRFSNNPLVTGNTKIRFYAGAPLYSTSGLAIGSLCVIDTVPRKLNELQRQALLTLARQVSSELELRMSNKLLIKEREEAKLANSSLQQLFKVIAHDLRSPFQGILGITQLIEESYDSFTRKDILEYIELLGDSASDTYNLLENLLEWSTLEVGTMQFRAKTLTARELVEDAIKPLLSSAAGKNITVTIEIDPSHQVTVDRKMISSVIRNLVNNSIKFSSENSTVTLSTLTKERSLVFAIDDNGTGLSESQIRLISEKKSIESSAGTNGEYGSGIGLHLVHSFLEMHNTRIKVESAPGQGTRICFDLPLTA